MNLNYNGKHLNLIP